MQFGAKSLSAVLAGIIPVTTDEDRQITSLVLDSREVTEGALFVALKGTQQHGLVFADVAIQKGAVAIVWESDESVSLSESAIPQIEISNLRDQLGLIANRFYGFPSQSLDMVGITGTDGKTSVSHFIAQALSDCAVMGTIGIGRLDDLQTASLTTPDVISVHKNLATMKSQGIQHVAMEVSSHALHQGRVEGVEFNVAVLTNLSRDHLDYHGTVEAYAEAKEQLFKWSNLKAMVVNLDDGFGQRIYQQAMQLSKKGGGAITNNATVIPYGVGRVDDYPQGTLVAEKAYFNNQGVSAQLNFEGRLGELKASVLGRFNLSNLLAALGAMLALGETLEDGLLKINQVQTVAGRMEKISDEVFLTVIDYAHTPNALEAVLKALGEHLNDKQENNLICVFGCGGDRDTGKRPIMAKVAEQYADVVIVTDDNPRSESPQIIMQDIVAGFDKPNVVIVEHDRATAIQIALSQAEQGDAVLIAGKGHENVQILATGTIPFSDRQQANKVLQELAA
ncbi:MAG: UDP-N-acetylmuramoyl-L-alanyl-D-glutamate--2,6-diaminopimelate ligase [Cocleimonas sp.]